MGRPLILEAHDRLGGRTWFDRRLGTSPELGGTRVHPALPTVSLGPPVARQRHLARRPPVQLFFMALWGP